MRKKKTIHFVGAVSCQQLSAALTRFFFLISIGAADRMHEISSHSHLLSHIVGGNFIWSVDTRSQVNFHLGIACLTSRSTDNSRGMLWTTGNKEKSMTESGTCRPSTSPDTGYAPRQTMKIRFLAVDAAGHGQPEHFQERLRMTRDKKGNWKVHPHVGSAPKRISFFFWPWSETTNQFLIFFSLVVIASKKARILHAVDARLHLM